MDVSEGTRIPDSELYDMAEEQESELMPSMNGVPIAFDEDESIYFEELGNSIAVEPEENEIDYIEEYSDQIQITREQQIKDELTDLLYEIKLGPPPPEVSTGISMLDTPADNSVYERAKSTFWALVQELIKYYVDHNKRAEAQKWRSFLVNEWPEILKAAQNQEPKPPKPEFEASFNYSSGWHMAFFGELSFHIPDYWSIDLDLTNVFWNDPTFKDFMRDRYFIVRHTGAVTHIPVISDILGVISLPLYQYTRMVIHMKTNVGFGATGNQLTGMKLDNPANVPREGMIFYEFVKHLPKVEGVDD